MRWLFRGLIVGVLLIAALVTAQIIASESGEVVVVASRDAQGEVHTTRLWVVDLDGAAWLRSGSTQASWYQRMQANPQVEVTRDERAFQALAVPVPDARDGVNELMLAKYGWADQFISFLYGRDDAIAIRLEPTGQN